MSFAAHHLNDLPIKAPRASTDVRGAASGARPAPKALLMQGLRLLLAFAVIALITVAAVGLKFVIMMPSVMR